MELPSRRDRIIGLLALFAGVGLFSTIEVSSKIVGARVHPFQMVFIRFFITGLVLLAFSATALRKRALPLSWRDYGLFALNGALSFALAVTLFHAAVLVFEKAASCAVVFSANPIFVMFFARYLNQEPWNIPKWVALGAGTLGIACFAWESGALPTHSPAALSLMLAAAMLFALGLCIARRVIIRYGVFVFTGFSSLFGSLLVLPFAIFVTAQYGFGGLHNAWLPLLYVVLPGTALAYGLYYYGLGYGTVFQGSMMFFLKPVMASVIAIIVLDEHINRFMVLGSLLILAGLVITVGHHLRSADLKKRT